MQIKLEISLWTTTIIIEHSRSSSDFFRNFPKARNFICPSTLILKVAAFHAKSGITRTGGILRGDQSSWVQQFSCDRNKDKARLREQFCLKKTQGCSHLRVWDLCRRNINKMPPFILKRFYYKKGTYLFDMEFTQWTGLYTSILYGSSETF